MPNELITKSFQEQCISFPARVDKMLAEVTTVQDAKGMLDQAAAMSHYAERLKAGVDIERPIAIGVLKIKAKLGELLPAKPPNDRGQGRNAKSSNAALPDFSKPAISAYRKIASHREKLESYYAEVDDVPTQGGFLQYVKSDKKKTSRAAKTKRERSAISTTPTLHVCGVADLAKHVRKSSVDVVITDPPYPKKFLPVYDDLGKFCSHALKPSGILVCMVGQSYLPDIMARLSEHLTYRWCCAYLTPGGQSAQLWDRKVNTFWKPLLIFSKGESKPERWIGDVYQSDVNDNDKDHHHWGQSESGMSRIIRAFSEPKDHVCDPFLGGGTTAVVACDMGRAFTGCDIKEACVETTRKRMA